MPPAATSTSNVITLRGSTEIVTEFFHYSVNNILYQRGVYPPESFKRVAQYGLALMVTTDEDLQKYLSNILKQLDGKHPIVLPLRIETETNLDIICIPNQIAWLMNGSVQKLVLVVKGVESGETLERWVFDVDCKVKDANKPNE